MLPVAYVNIPGFVFIFLNSSSQQKVLATGTLKLRYGLKFYPHIGHGRTMTMKLSCTVLEGYLSTPSECVYKI